MNALKIVQLDAATLPVALPKFEFPHTLTTYHRTAPNEVTAHIQNADIVITNKVKLTAKDIASAKNLKIIGVPAIGVDHLDMQAVKAREIFVYNAAGYASQGVAEHALMMMLVLRRRLADYQQSARDGRWSKSPLFCYFGEGCDDLSTQTLGLIGSGGIGNALAEMAKGIGMQVLRAERPYAKKIRTGYHEFLHVLKKADVLSLHCPLNAETEKLINAERLAKMKNSAILINTGRGGLIDEKALLTALHSGNIAAAGLDVLSVEPPPLDHPLLQYSGDNLLITPHAAWLGRATLQRLVGILHQKIEDGVNNKIK